MAISFYGADSINAVSPTISKSFTCSSNPYRYLVAVGANTVTALTYAGVNMTKLVTFLPSISDGNEQNMIVWGLANPASGSNTFEVTDSGNSTVCWAQYDGVDTVQPEDYETAFSNNGVNNTQVGGLSATVTTIKNNSWTVLFTKGGNNLSTFVAGAGTLRATNVFIFGNGAFSIIDSGVAISPAGGSTLTANWNSSTGFISNVIISLTERSPLVGQMNIL